MWSADIQCFVNTASDKELLAYVDDGRRMYRTLQEDGDLLLMPSHYVIAERILSGSEAYGLKFGLLLNRCIERDHMKKAKL